jgi:hypothetical protein
VAVKDICLNPFGGAEAMRAGFPLKSTSFGGKHMNVFLPGLGKEDRKQPSCPKASAVLIGQWYHFLQAHNYIIGHYLLTCEGRERAE